MFLRSIIFKSLREWVMYALTQTTVNAHTHTQIQRHTHSVINGPNVSLRDVSSLNTDSETTGSI